MSNIVEFSPKPTVLEPTDFRLPRPNRLAISVSDAMLGAVSEIGEKDHRKQWEVLVLLLEAGIVAYQQSGVQLSQLRHSLMQD